MQITDGTGTNFAVKVNDHNRIEATAICETEIHHDNKVEKQVYQVKIFLTPEAIDPSATGTDDLTFFYCKNNSETPMVIEEFRIWVESAEYIDLYKNSDGTPINTTDITPGNLNFGSGNTATGLFYKGIDIDGMSGGTFVDRFRIPADDIDHVFTYSSKIIIPKNNIITLVAGTGGIPLEVSMLFYYHNNN